MTNECAPTDCRTAKGRKCGSTGVKVTADVIAASETQ